MTAAADLSVDTAVEAIGEGSYRAALSDRWSYIHPCGGVLMTIALRAMRHELADPTLRILSATTLFCQPVPPGGIVCDVVVLRRGKSASQLRASLRSEGHRVGLEVTATFAKEKEGPDVHGIEAPDVPPPEHAVKTSSRRGERAPSTFKIYDNLELALALGEPMWKPGWRAGPAHIAFWYRYRVPQRDDEGSFDPLAIPPIADTIPPALSRKLGPEADRFIMPSLDLTVFFVAPTKSEWLLVESFVERARAGYAVGSANLWDEERRLVARAAQSMTLRRFER